MTQTRLVRRFPGALTAVAAAAVVAALGLGPGCRQGAGDGDGDAAAPARTSGGGPPPQAPGALPLSAGTPQPIAAEGTWRDVAAEYLNSCGIRSDGSLWCWGRNTTGQLGDGTTMTRSEPHRVGSDTDWLSVEPGDHFTCGLRAGGAVWCWGDHKGGVPGRGIRVTSHLPERLDLRDRPGGAPLRFAELSVGDGHLCGLTTDGAAWCWGKPGVIGDGKEEFAPSPRRVTVSHIDPPPRFETIATGTHHSCALTDDGRIYCWGQEDHGQTGDGGGPQDERLTPVAVDTSAVQGEPRFAALSASTYHTCALARDGAAYCWGSNQFGQLGVGDTRDRPAPTPVDRAPLPPGTVFARIDCGFSHTCALERDGTLWCWGEVAQESHGPTPPGPALRPIAIDTPGLPQPAHFRQVSAGVAHSCAIATDGRAYCWGNGSDGQLGVGPGPLRP